MKRLFGLLMTVLLLAGFLRAADNILELPTVTGKKIHIKGITNGFDIKEYRGKIVFIEMWGINCPPCLMSIPHYVRLISKYKNDLAMMAIEIPMRNFPPTSRETLKKFIEEKGINYDILAYDDVSDFVNYFAQATGWR